MKSDWFKKAAMWVMILIPLLIGTVLAASAEDLTWSFLDETEEGYETKLSPAWTIEVGSDGSLYWHNGSTGALYVYDKENVLGTYQTFSMGGDFYFEAFPLGLRDEQYTPEDRPLSFLCWNLGGQSPANNALRLDSEGYVYTGTSAGSKTEFQFKTDEWYNVRVVFMPKTGQCEMLVNGEKVLDFYISPFHPSVSVSESVRFFDNYYSWSARMKNLFVKTDSNYVVGEVEEKVVDEVKSGMADYIGYQASKVKDGVFSLRAILGVDSTEFNRIGYEVLVLQKDEGGNVLAESISNRSKVIYETLKDNSGKTYNVKELYDYNYAAAIEIEDLPAELAYEYIEIVVRSYVLGMDGIRRYGKSTVLTYSGDVDADGYPSFARIDERFYKVLVSDDTETFLSGSYMADDLSAEHALQCITSGDPSTDPTCAAYYKFTLSPELAKIVDTAASARVYVCVRGINSPHNEIVVHGAGTDWNEHELNGTNVKELAPTFEYIGESTVQDKLFFSVDVLQYVREQPLNADGSLDVAFRMTHKECGNAGELIYLYSKEDLPERIPYLEIVSSIYEHPLGLEKYNNEGNADHEPWGYAEHLADEWFGGLRDEIWPKDENGNSVYHEIQGLHANGYGATEATGDFTKEMPWIQLAWRTTSQNDYKIPVDEWEESRFARTLSTLGTIAANEFLSSEYASHIAEYDVYGGITNAGFTGEATGFFHVENHGGRPYIIDPLGNPYFAVGMNEVKIRGTMNQQDYVLSAFGTKENYFENISGDLMAIGVNTAFESDEASLLAVENGLSVAVNFGTVGAYMKTIGRNALTGDGLMGHNNTRCIFEPGYEREAQKIISEQITAGGYVGNPRVLGYTTDNELPSDEDMLDKYLTLDAGEKTNAFSYATAWTWLARRMNDPYPTLEKFRNSPEADDIRREFLGFWYARYYKVVSEAIKSVDPDHMYIGSRANLNSLVEEWIIRAAGHYTDLITANLYGGLNPKSDTINNLYRFTGKPFIVTEFFSKGADAIDANGYKMANSVGAGIQVLTQQNRADYYEHYTLALLESQACVGWTWYRFRDNDQSLFRLSNGKTVYMASMMYGTNAGPLTFMDGDGKTYYASNVGEYEKIYSGDGIASNQNVNKGLYNSTFHSVVSVYTYDKNGKLLSSMSYEVEDPESAAPKENEILFGLNGSAFFIGKKESANGYTETVLTVYKGQYLPLANSIKTMNDHIIGLVNYFDAQ